MKIIHTAAETEEYIKKSRFIGVIKPCQTEAEALQSIKALHLLHPAASHIVYAYRVQSPQGLVCRFNDAGEPSGTAGKPVFQHLEGKQLLNVLVAVIRYYGGVKLGAGGLTRAYSNLAKQAIDCVELVEYVEYCELQLTVAYNRLQALEYQLQKLDGCILAQEFAEQVGVKIKIPKHNSELLMSFIAA